MDVEVVPGFLAGVLHLGAYGDDGAGLDVEGRVCEGGISLYVLSAIVAVVCPEVVPLATCGEVYFVGFHLLPVDGAVEFAVALALVPA